MTHNYFYIVFTTVSTRGLLRRKLFISYQRLDIVKPLYNLRNIIYYACIIGYMFIEIRLMCKQLEAHTH